MNKSVYTMNERQISMMIRDNQANSILNTDYKGVQIVCYEQDQMHESVGCAEQACAGCDGNMRNNLCR